MTIQLREYRIQLKSADTGETIISSGGVVQVCQNGLPDKAALYDKNGAVVSNPVALNNGFLNFFVDGLTVPSVDLYGISGGGHFFTRANIAPGGPNEIALNTQLRRQVAKIPFSIADSVAGTEKDTGFDIPTPGQILDRLHGCALQVTALETAGAKTITVGLLSSQSGGAASGFINGSSTAALGMVTGTNGSLFSSNAPANSDAQTAKRISYTLVTASVAAKGFIYLPYTLG